VLVEEQPTYIVQQVALSAPTRDVQNLHFTWPCTEPFFLRPPILRQGPYVQVAPTGQAMPSYPYNM